MKIDLIEKINEFSFFRRIERRQAQDDQRMEERRAAAEARYNFDISIR